MIAPDEGKTAYQFLVSAAGSYDDYRDSDENWNPVWTNAARIGANEYVVEIAIPLKEIRLQPFRNGTGLLLSFGRTDRTSGESLSSYGGPYGDLNQAPVFILGTEAEYQTRLKSELAITTNATIDIYLDRDQYPSFETSAAGRIRIKSAGSSGMITNVNLLLSLTKAGKETGAESIELTAKTFDFDLPLQHLALGTYELNATLKAGEKIIKTQKKEFVVQEAKAQKSGKVPITVPAFPGSAENWPLTFGIPFPWGALDSEEHVRLVNEAGVEIPIQTKVTCRWSKKGSIRWLLVDCLVPAREQEQKFTLEYGAEVQRGAFFGGIKSGQRPRAELATHQDTSEGGRRAPWPSSGRPHDVSRTMEFSDLKIEQTETNIVVDTGKACFVFAKHKTPGLCQVLLDKTPVFLSNPDYGAYMVDESGKKYLGSLDSNTEVAVETAGPLKACVRVSGWHVAPTGERLGKYILRYYMYAGLPYVRVYHTFIITASSNADTGASKEEVRYRDIAYSLPFSTTYGFLGTPTIYPFRLGTGNSVYLVQRNDSSCRIYKDGRFDDECEKAEGWMSVGRPGGMLTVAMKDFWQNFPKEFEVTPQAALIHFWPAHNEAALHTVQNTSIRNVYPLWFAHEGKLLDFKVPKETLDIIMPDEKTKKEWAKDNPGALVANAIGLAKTHEFLLYFHAADWERAQARTVSRLFQSNPTAVCDPQWVCASGVFGPMAPRDPQKFPAIERTIDEIIACIFRQQKLWHDHGMFNYGDAHHNLVGGERRLEIYRLWRNTHQGWTRWPWMMYARSGIKEIFDWADRNARHVADIDHCHYTTKEFSSLLWPKGKIVGGLCDYKGFVHWSAGNRLCYNSIADSLLWHYYFTGDERSRETTLEHGAALIKDGSAQSHREGSGRATSACELYYYTWDNDYLDFLERTVDCLLKTQNEDGSFPQWENFAPFLQRYIELTQSRRGMTAMAKWSASPHIQYDPLSINVRSYAWLYSGALEHLRKAAYFVHYYFVDAQYLGDDPLMRGICTGTSSDENMCQSYFLQGIPYYLYAVTRQGAEPEPLLLGTARVRVFSRKNFDGKPMNVFEARLRQKEDKPFKLQLRINNCQKPPCIAEIAGQGRTPLRVIGTNANSVLEFQVPADGICDYSLRIAAEAEFRVPLPLTAGDDNFKEAYNNNKDNELGPCRCYFDLPEGVKSFQISYQGRYGVNRFSVFDANGNIVGTDTWYGDDIPMQWMKCAVSGSGKGYSFSFIGRGVYVGEMKYEPAQPQKPFYISAERDKLFAPDW
jgi:hypothetical protein